eukprot:9489998-Pyramimonas_sp.AAC.1
MSHRASTAWTNANPAIGAFSRRPPHGAAMRAMRAPNKQAGWRAISPHSCSILRSSGNGSGFGSYCPKVYRNMPLAFAWEALAHNSCETVRRERGDV